MIQIGNFFFKYRNLLFPIIGLLIFIPSPRLFTAEVFGDRYYMIPFILGITIALLGQVIRALTIGLKYIVRGGKDKKVYAEDLVTDGIFGHCRNPLYVGNILMLLGVGLISNSLFFLLFVVPFFCFIYHTIVLAEENYLRNKFGVNYLAYTSEVNRWIPDFSGLGNTLSSMEFNWRRYLINEYNTIYMLVISILLVIFTHNPELIQLPNQERWEIFLYWFLAISMVYLFVRYLKKIEKVNSKSNIKQSRSNDRFFIYYYVTWKGATILQNTYKHRRLFHIKQNSPRVILSSIRKPSLVGSGFNMCKRLTFI